MRLGGRLHRRWHGVWFWPVLLSIWIVVGGAGAAATDAKPVTVVIEGLDDRLRANVEAFLEIYQFSGKPAPSAARLRYLHKQAEGQIEKALQPFGFYRPDIETYLEETATGWVARYQVAPGTPVPVAGLDLLVEGEGRDDEAFAQALAETTLRGGQPLDQAAYEALKRRLQVLAAERGYFNAELKAHQIRVELASYRAFITLHFDTGFRYHLGDVTFKQEPFSLNEAFLRRFVELKPGQPYDSNALQKLQGDLTNTEYFDRVEVNASPETAVERTIPVEVVLAPLPPRKYTFGVGYGTDTGVRGKVGINGRRVNQWGHHYNLELLASQIKYGLAGEYVIPGSDPRTDAYGLRASLEDEHSDNRNYQAFNVGGYYKFRDRLWLKTYALDYRIERFDLGEGETTSQLLIPSADWTRVYPAAFESRIYAVNGAWLQLRLRGAYEALLSDTSFLQPLVSAKWIRSFESNSRVIARTALGTTWVDDFDKLPASLRFYAGGDYSVRGYKYNTIAPRNDKGEVVGGKHLMEAALEYEHPVADKWSVAAFVDTGDAFDEGGAELKTGVGFGVRWRSPIGPVRVDLATALDRPPGSEIRLHLTIGPDL